MPNGTYWVYVVMHNTAGVGTGYSSGPVRIEKPVPATPSYYVPLNPARLLDTRTGEGGNVFPLGTGAFTELDVTGVGGVPEFGATAVVMNVTVTGPTSSGFITAWPSGDFMFSVIERLLRLTKVWIVRRTHPSPVSRSAISPWD